MGFKKGTTINPRVIFVQATEPDDKTEGKLWYNISTNELLVSDGTTYDSIEPDIDYINDQQLAQNLNILINSASASALNDYDDMFVDIFSDADGYDDTIDTGNTTANFANISYINSETTLEDNFNRTDSATVGNSWVETETGGTCAISSNTLVVTRVNGATSCIKTIAGGNAPTEIEVKMKTSDITATTNFYFTSTAGYLTIIQIAGSKLNHYVGSAYVEITDTTVVNDTYVTVTLKNINYVADTYDIWVDGVEKMTGVSFNDSSVDLIATTALVSTDGVTGTFDYISFQKANKIVQTNVITVDTAQVAHQVYSHSELSGTGTITYDISFDNGSTWDIDQALNTKNTRTATTGTQMILKLKLNGVGIDNMAIILDYGLMLFY